MTSEKSKVLNQIKKMFALAGNNPSPEEAELAMTKAQELMFKHSLTQGDVDSSSQEDNEEVHGKVINESRILTPHWQRVILAVVVPNMRCDYFYTRYDDCYDIKIIGLETDVNICTETVNFVFRYFKSSWKYFKRHRPEKGLSRYKTNRAKASYTEGFGYGLSKVFRRNVVERGLIIVTPHAVTEYMDSLNLKTNTSSRRAYDCDQEAEESGYVAGKSAVKDKFIE